MSILPNIAVIGGSYVGTPDLQKPPVHISQANGDMQVSIQHSNWLRSFTVVSKSC